MKNRQLVKNLCFGMAFFILLSCVNAPKARAATATLLTTDVTITSTTQVVIGSNIFFTATGPTGGEELWKINTSTNTASLVKDIYSGSSSSSPSELTAVGFSLFFVANDGVHGRELWKSDGTEEGTALVKDIYPGSNGSLSSTSYLTSIAGVAFFSANDGTNGAELWKSDGTTNGTVLVKDIAPGSNKGTPLSSGIGRIVDMNGVAFFPASDGTNGRLWKSDGTANGTVAIASSGASAPNMIAVVNGVLFFAGSDSGGRELWKSDGTEIGTALVKDIWPGGSSSDPGRTQQVNQKYIVFNNTLYFAADDGTNGEELWKSDGTTNGTVLVKDICPGVGASNPGGEGLTLYNTFASLGSKIYFVAHDCSTGDELWGSDGTDSGTTLVKDIQPGSVGGFGTSNIFVNNSKLYFAADDTTGSGFELWQSDGTNNGTSFVVDINTGSANGFPSVFASYDTILYLLASNNAVFDGTYGVWSYNTTVTAAGGHSYADTTPPDTPTKITTTTDGKSVLFKWTDPTASDLSRIEVLRNNGGGSGIDGGNPIGFLPPGTTTYTDTLVTPGETYTYILRSRDTSGNLAITDEIKIKVEIPKPPETPAASVPPMTPSPSVVATPNTPITPEAPKPLPVFTQQDFFLNGTPATKSLGQREREALWRDYIAIYGTEPMASALDMMSTGIVPFVDAVVEKSQAKNVLPYWRAITGKRTLVPVSKRGFSIYNTLVYRLRYERDLKKEVAGIKQFRRAFHKNPSTPVEWASVRAWAYIE